MTPIDPTDRTRLYESFGKAAREDTDDPFAGMMAVARAVCPEHHAVYDTRAHVAVPIADIHRYWDRTLTAVTVDGAHLLLDTVSDTEEWLESLLPESEATND